MTDFDPVEMRARHVRFTEDELDMCMCCSHNWPCDTTQALDRIAELDELVETHRDGTANVRDATEFQRHRDRWRRYAYGKCERPTDFLSSPVNTRPTEIDTLSTKLAAVPGLCERAWQDGLDASDEVSDLWHHLKDRDDPKALEKYRVAVMEIMRRDLAAILNTDGAK